MEKYSIYCTESQTKKALELGAPIEIDSHSHGRPYIQNGTSFYLCPTAEQMINWLEEQYPINEISVYKTTVCRKRLWSSAVFNKEGGFITGFPHTGVKSRKDATLDIIDAALEYLMNNKK